MSRQFSLELPPTLEVYRDQLEATLKPYLEIQAEASQDLAPWQSKFGGVPYLPKNFDYPRTAKGQYFYLLAQINFQEVPALKGFPKQGILQFYLADDDLYGTDFKNLTEQKGFRVLYFENLDLNPDHLMDDFAFLPEPEDFPLTQCHALKFSKQYEPITPHDYRCQLFLGEALDNLISDYIDEQWEEEDNLFNSCGHKLGGYPCFAQGDPREGIGLDEEPYELLLQIDSEDEIMWGDCGVGNFFIKPSALKQKNFSDILYTWDCD